MRTQNPSRITNCNWPRSGHSLIIQLYTGRSIHEIRKYRTDVEIFKRAERGPDFIRENRGAGESQTRKNIILVLPMRHTLLIIGYYRHRCVLNQQTNVIKQIINDTTTIEIS